MKTTRTVATTATPRTRRNSRATAAAPSAPAPARTTFPFKPEMRTYRKHFAKLRKQKGMFVLVKGSELFGPFATYSEAIGEGYSRFALTGFMVKEIEDPEVPVLVPDWVLNGIR